MEDRIGEGGASWYKDKGTNIEIMKKYLTKNWENDKHTQDKNKRLCYGFWSGKQEINVILKVSWDIPCWYPLLHCFNLAKNQGLLRLAGV